MENNTGVIHDTSEIVPYIGMTGLYALKAPYTSLIDESIEYTCIAVNTISSMLSDGLNPLADIYLANGDTQGNYDLDEENNRTIITLQSGVGGVIVIPNSALMLLPNSDGINYTSVVLGVSLSVIPDTLDLTDLKQNIGDLVFNKLGVRNTVFSTVMGGSIVVNHTRHAAIEAARLSNISSGSNALLNNIILQQTNADLVLKIQKLELFIKTRLNP